MIQVAKKASVLKRRNTKQRMEPAGPAQQSPSTTPAPAAPASATAATTPATPATSNSTVLAGTPSAGGGAGGGTTMGTRRDSEGEVVFYIDDHSKAGEPAPRRGANYMICF